MKLILTSDTHYGHNHKTQTKHMRFLKKLAEESPDVLVHAGDWASHSQHQLYRTLQMFRESLKCPIVAVRGNHDFWQSTDKYHPFLPTEKVLETHQAWFEEFDIHHVSKGALKVQDWTFYGFDGWYGYHNPPTNDARWMPMMTESLTTMEWFQQKAHADLVKMLDTKEEGKEKKLCVSHFPTFTEDQRKAHYCANLNYLEVLTENFELLLFGHSHRACDWNFRGTRIVNCGSDYNKPVYKVLEL
jgi:predicted phosphodiesterase